MKKIRKNYGVGAGDKTLYSNLEKGYQTDRALASLQNDLGSNITVVTYAGTDSGLSSVHMAETINNYRSVNPFGRVIMIGHILGGKDVLNAANSAKECIDLVLTMEPVSVNAGGGFASSGSPYSLDLNGNVANITVKPFYSLALRSL